jgi:DNA repair exonuclease SbcCD ATPase subunit
MAALPLIAMAEDGKMSVPEETVSLLGGIEEPVAIISVAGPYRSGKSFLMNCLSQDDGQGGGMASTVKPVFEVGPTINACTRGLWMHPAQVSVKQPDGSKLRVIFVDSEGLGAIKSDEQHDLHIFSLAVLTSSLFIFNSTGAIDEANIKKLSFITQLSKNIHINASGPSDNPDDFEEFFPAFLWVLRDFALKLKDKDGNPINERKYLEESLKREIGFDEDVTARNRIRMMLTAFFKQRDCVGLQRPIIDEASLAKLASGDAQVRDTFVQQINMLKKKIYSQLKPKILHGRALTGPMLATVLTSYVTAINDGGVPNVANAWEAVREVQSQAATTKSLASFKERLGTDEDGEMWSFPTTQDRLRKIYTLAKAQALKAMESDMLERDDAALSSLEEQMQAEFELLEARNAAELAAQTQAMLNEKWQPVHERVTSGDLDEWSDLMREWEAVASGFKAAAPDGCDVEATLAAFLMKAVLADASAVASNSKAKAEAALAEATQAAESAETKLTQAVSEHQAANLAAEKERRVMEDELRGRVEKVEGERREAQESLMTERSEAAIKSAELEFAKKTAEERLAEASSKAKELEATVSELRESLDTTRQSEMDKGRELEIAKLGLEQEKQTHQLTKDAAATAQESLKAKAAEASEQAETNARKLEEVRKDAESDSGELAELKTSMAKQLRESETRCAELERTSAAKALELENAAEIASVREDAEISTFKVKAELATSENERLSKIVERLEQDKTAVKDELTTRADVASAVQDKDVAVLEERVRNLESSLEETLAEKKEASSLLSATEKELQTFKVTSAKGEASHESAVQVLEKQIESLNTELETMRTTASGQDTPASRAEVAATIAKAEEQREAIATMKTELATASDSLVQKSEEVTELKLQLTALEKDLTIKTMEAERAAAESRFDKEKTQLLQEVLDARGTAEGSAKVIELERELATLREREKSGADLKANTDAELARLRDELSASAASLAAAEGALAAAKVESAAALEKARAEVASLETKVAKLSKLESAQRKRAIQVAARMVTVWRQKELRNVVRAWRHAAVGQAEGGGFGFDKGGGGGAIEGMAAADLHAKEEEMTQQIQGLTYRRRYIALRPVFREIFNKFDKNVRA